MHLAVLYEWVLYVFLKDWRFHLLLSVQNSQIPLGFSLFHLYPMRFFGISPNALDQPLKESERRRIDHIIAQLALTIEKKVATWLYNCSHGKYNCHSGGWSRAFTAIIKTLGHVGNERKTCFSQIKKWVLWCETKVKKTCETKIVY